MNKITVTEEIFNEYKDQAQAEYEQTQNPWAYRYLIHMEKAIARINSYSETISQLQREVEILRSRDDNSNINWPPEDENGV